MLLKFVPPVSIADITGERRDPRNSMTGGGVVAESTKRTPGGSTYGSHAKLASLLSFEAIL